MGKLVEHLMPCAICGAVPKINDIYDIDPEKAEHCYKLFCSENGVHNSTGEWFANKYKACQDWNRRQQALEEKEKTFGDKLKPCPFCGRKMQFHNDVRLDRNGKRRNYLYESRKAAGICVYCGKKPAVSGKVACVMCAKRDAKRHMEKNRKMGMLPRCLFGDGYHCVICGKDIDNGKKQCDKCYRNSVHALEIARANIQGGWKNQDFVFGSREKEA